MSRQAMSVYTKSWISIDIQESYYLQRKKKSGAAILVTASYNIVSPTCS